MAVVEKLYGSFVMISETANGSVWGFNVFMRKPVRHTSVERDDSRSATKREDYTSLLPVSHMSGRVYGTTHQYNIRKCKEEEWPLEILPVGCLVLWLVVPQLEFLQERTLFVTR